MSEKDIQQALLRLGYQLPRFGADGHIGTETLAALAAFRKDRGLSSALAPVDYAPYLAAALAGSTSGLKFDHVAVVQSRGALKLGQHQQAMADILTPQRAADFRFLLTRMEEDRGYTDLRWIAYTLATVLRECGPNFKPIREIASPSDPKFLRYEQAPLGKVLGNTQPGDGMLFCGRGYCQLTGRGNYARFQRLIGEPLVSQPGLALEPERAYRILSMGMRFGYFTGRALSHYITAGKCDYVNARRIVNGLDHAQEIADNAVVFEAALKSALL
jgi:predicted chitinase